MTIPVQIQLGNHSLRAHLYALPHKGDALACSFPSSIGAELLQLRVQDVTFRQPNVQFEGKECPEPFVITILVDGDPKKKAENDAVMARALHGTKGATGG